MVLARMGLVPDLRRNAFNFLPLRIMFAVGLPYTNLYYVEMVSPYAHFLEVFVGVVVVVVLPQMGVEVCPKLFLYLFRLSCGLVNMVYHID